MFTTIIFSIWPDNKKASNIVKMCCHKNKNQLDLIQVCEAEHRWCSLLQCLFLMVQPVTKFVSDGAVCYKVSFPFSLINSDFYLIYSSSGMVVVCFSVLVYMFFVLFHLRPQNYRIVQFFISVLRIGKDKFWSKKCFLVNFKIVNRISKIMKPYDNACFKGFLVILKMFLRPIPNSISKIL